MTDVTKAAVVVVATNKQVASDFSKILGEMAVGELMSGGLHPTKSLFANTMYVSTEELRMLLTQEAAIADDRFTEADVKIYAAMDQPATELLKELERMTQAVKMEGNHPLFYRLDEAVAEYCQTHNIRRLWVHCLDTDTACVDIVRRLSRSGIMPVGATTRVDREILSLIVDAAAACKTNAPRRQVFLDKLRRALEFFTRQTSTQAVLVGHWAWPAVNALPREVHEPYLLSSTEIYLNKLTEVMLSYCQD